MTRDGDFELVTLRNGARAVRHLGHGEVMHPSVGPWREANLLYVEQTRLAERLADLGAAPLRIYDVGLGAGANAVAALACAAETPSKARRRLEIVSFEVDLAPLRLALSDEAGFGYLAPWREAAQTLMRERRFQGDGVEWTLELGDALEGLGKAPRPADLVFFDPFSPEKNPRLWTRPALAEVRAACRDDGSGALLVTYSASTRVRTALLLTGFFVGAGRAVGTKQETTVASTRLDALERPLGPEWLDRWRRSTAKAPPGEEATDGLEAALAAHPQFASLRR